MRRARVHDVTCTRIILIWEAHCARARLALLDIVVRVEGRRERNLSLLPVADASSGTATAWRSGSRRDFWNLEKYIH